MEKEAHFTDKATKAQEGSFDSKGERGNLWARPLLALAVGRSVVCQLCLPASSLPLPLATCLASAHWKWGCQRGALPLPSV